MGLAFDRFDGARGARLLPETMGGGVTFFDHDADGDPDLLALARTRPGPATRRRAVPPTPSLWRNDAGRFVEHHRRGRARLHPCRAWPPYAADVDADGRRRTCCSPGSGARRLLRQSGGRYLDATATPPVSRDAQATPGRRPRCSSTPTATPISTSPSPEYVQWSRCWSDARNREHARRTPTAPTGRPTQFEGTHLRLYPQRRRRPVHRRRPRGGPRRCATRPPARPLAKTLGHHGRRTSTSTADLDLVAGQRHRAELRLRATGPGGRFEEQRRRTGLAFDAGGPRPRCHGHRGGGLRFDDGRLDHRHRQLRQRDGGALQPAGPAPPPSSTPPSPPGLGGPERGDP
jgi:hypothetical protein